MGATCCGAVSSFAELDGSSVRGAQGRAEVAAALRLRADAIWATLAHGKDNKVAMRDAAQALFEAAAFVPAERVRAALSALAIDGHFNRRVSHREFRDVVQAAMTSTPPVAAELFEQASGGGKRVTPAALAQFMKESSHGWVTPTAAECEALIAACAPRRATGRQHEGGGEPKRRSGEWRRGAAPGLGPKAFADLVLDARHNGWGDPERLQHVYMDMTRPLSEYFVSSSHNSALEGNQWRSRSSGDAVRRALLLGVRVIELDAWEGEDGEPIVTHGHTLCAPTSFQDCVEAVRDYGAATSEYPVILTIENHCGLAQQQRQAAILRELLGTRLWGHDRGKTDSLSLEELMKGPSEWLSPKALRGRVVIRDKPVKRRKRKDEHTARRASAMLERHRRRSAGAAGSLAAAASGFSGGGSGSSFVGGSGSFAGSSGSFAGSERLQHVDEGAEPLRKRRAATGDGNLAPMANAGGRGGAFDDNDEDDDSSDSQQAAQQQQQQQLGEEPESALQAKVRRAVSLRVASRGVLGFGRRVSVHVAARRRRPSSKTIRSSTSSGDTGSAVASEAPADELDLDEDAVEALSMLQEAVRLGSADKGLLELMYIKNVKLQYRLLPGGGVAFEEPPFRCSSSLDERRMAILSKTPDRAAAVADYTRRHMLRVYPNNARVDSSNFAPTPFWSCGVQFVALNVQRNSKAVWLAQGKFADNGGCGFVRKPRMLRELSPTVPPPAVVLRVAVLSGHYLVPGLSLSDPASGASGVPTDLAVKVGLHGAREDEASYKTRFVKRNAFDPVWNQACEFSVERPDLALVLLVVKDAEGNCVGQSCLPLSCLRPGFRMVGLNTAACVPMRHASLFVFLC